MRVDALIRVSKVRGRSGPSFISPEQQREKIEAYCRVHGYELAAVHDELDVPAGQKRRPGLERAVARIEAGQTGGLVIAKVDRFGRNLVHGLSVIERIEAAGGMFASVLDQFDTATPHGRFVLRIMLSLAELELDRVRENFDDARRRAVARGIHPCPVPPAGYRRREDDTGLRPHPKWGPVITELIERAAQDEPWADLARWLTATGMPTAYDNHHFTGRSVKEIVRNRVYLGIAYHGEYENRHAHEPLTGEVTWRRAQRPGRKNTSRSASPSLLASLLRCASCRYVVKSHLAHGGHRQYQCHRVHSRGRCPNPARAAVSTGIEEVVVERFFDAVGEVGATADAGDAAALEELQATADKADRALAAFRDDPDIVSALGKTRFVEGLRRHAQRADEAHAALSAERDRSAAVLVEQRADLRTHWPTLTVPEKRQLLGLVFDAIFLEPGTGPVAERLHFCMRGDAPEDMPRRGRKGAATIRPFVPSVASA